MHHIVTGLLALTLCACAPSLRQIQDTVAGYHVAAYVNGGGAVVASARLVAVTGQAGTRAVLTAQVAQGGPRLPILEHVLEGAGVAAWRVILRERDGEDWIRLEPVTCSEARAELVELPPCPVDSGIEGMPAAVERQIYIRR